MTLDEIKVIGEELETLKKEMIDEANKAKSISEKYEAQIKKSNEAVNDLTEVICNISTLLNAKDIQDDQIKQLQKELSKFVLNTRAKKNVF